MRTILLLLLTLSIYSVEMERRLGFDPIIQGLWTVFATSGPDGTNTQLVQPPIDIAQVTATVMVFADGSSVRANAVYIINDDAGHPANVAHLSDGRTVYVFKRPDQAFFVVHWHGQNGDETARWVIQVSD